MGACHALSCPLTRSGSPPWARHVWGAEGETSSTGEEALAWFRLPCKFNQFECLFQTGSWLISDNLKGSLWSHLTHTHTHSHAVRVIKIFLQSLYLWHRDKPPPLQLSLQSATSKAMWQTAVQLKGADIRTSAIFSPHDPPILLFTHSVTLHSNWQID